MWKRIQRINSRVSEHEKIQKFALLPRELTEDAGELTPTLKIKRRVVEERFGPLIEKMYEG